MRTYRARRGRITPRQQRALDRLWGRYGLGAGPAKDWPLDAGPLDAGPLDAGPVFGRAAPLVLEIGFGMGEATSAMAQADPDRDVLAVDVHTPGAGALLHEIEARGLRNVRVVLGDALDVLTLRLRPGQLDEVRIFFPDPWPKPRHHKRRLVRPDVVALLADRLRPGGLLHCATDWEPYARRMVEVLAAEPAFEVRGIGPRPATRPLTRFERQALVRGRAVRDVMAHRRVDGTAPG